MEGTPRVKSRQGFTLIEVVVVVLVVALISAGAVIALAPAQEAPVNVSMMGDVETFAALQARAYHERGAYEEPRALLNSGSMTLSPGVEVDSAAFSPGRVYLRVRHPASGARCSVDLSQVSRTARNRVQCFGGTARDSAEVVAVGEGAEVPVADTTAGALPTEPPVVAVLVAPLVEDPVDLTVAPGAGIDQSFVVTNRSATARTFQFRFSSTDPSLVGVPGDPAPATIAAGASASVRFVSSMASAAAAGRLSAVSLEVTDADDDALAGRGTFAAMVAVHLESPSVQSPVAVEVAPGDTVVLTWTVSSGSNVARMMDVSADASDPSLVLVSASGLGRVRFESGETRQVETRYRLVAPRTAGTVGSVALGVSDAGAAQYRGAGRTDVSTALVIAAPRLDPPADTSVAPGTSFTREWRITGRTNASRTYEVVAGFAGGGIESASLVGPGVIAIPENGSAVVVVSYRSRTDAAAGTVSSLELVVRDAGGGGETSGSGSATISLMPVAPDVAPPAGASGYVGDTAVMVFTVRNAGNGTRRFAIDASSGDPGVASVIRFDPEVEIPARGAVDVPVVVGFPWGSVARLDASVSVVARDVELPALSGAASGSAVRVNRSPSVHVVGPAREVAAGEEVLFSLSGEDPDGDLVGFGIEFGDGMSASGAVPTHAYYAPGIYYVRARAVDAFGLIAEDSLAVRVVAPTIGCMDPEASNYDPNANVSGDCTYGPTLVKTEELVRVFICDWEQGFVEYRSTDTWGRMYDHWSDGTITPAGDPYQISFTVEDLGPVTAAPYGLTCDTYTDDWP